MNGDEHISQEERTQRKAQYMAFGAAICILGGNHAEVDGLWARAPDIILKIKSACLIYSTVCFAFQTMLAIF